MKALSSIAADQLCFWYDCNGPIAEVRRTQLNGRFVPHCRLTTNWLSLLSLIAFTLHFLSVKDLSLSNLQAIHSR